MTYGSLFSGIGTHFVATRGVTTGCGYRIRAFTIFEKDAQVTMFTAERQQP